MELRAIHYPHTHTHVGRIIKIIKQNILKNRSHLIQSGSLSLAELISFVGECDGNVFVLSLLVSLYYRYHFSMFG